MKKLFLILVLCIIAVSIRAQSKDPVRFRTYAVKNKTITIEKSDKILGVMIMVPSTAAYNTLVSGDTLTMDGVASAPIPIHPGEGPITFGGKEGVIIGKLTIVARDSAYIFMVPARKNE